MMFSCCHPRIAEEAQVANLMDALKASLAKLQPEAAEVTQKPPKKAAKSAAKPVVEKKRKTS